MKKSFTVLLLLFFTASGFSQIRRQSSLNIKTDSAGHQQLAAAERGRRDVLKELDLTKEQKQRLKSIRENGQARRQLLEADTVLTDTERKQRLRALRRGQEDSVAKVLSPQQFEKFKALRQQQVKTAAAATQ